MLEFQAGPKALQQIRDRGLKPDDVTTVAGAAGGPKWIILGHLDRALFGPAPKGWFSDRSDPLQLVGASSGAWRFAASVQTDPLAAIERFEAAYIQQRYEKKPTPAEVSREATRILDRLLGSEGTDEVIRHPVFRLNIVTVRCRDPLTSLENTYGQGVGMAAAALFNLFHRKTLRWFFERVLFEDPRTRLSLSGLDGLPTRRIPLDSTNIRAALLATGSIPLVMAGVRNIPGAPAGIFRDGGVVDYHMDLPHGGDDDGIILFPHYSHRIIPGWLDKQLRWRRPAHLDRTLVISPSREFLDRLPYRKIPDRDDFWTFFGEDRRRIAYWRKAAEMGEQLSEFFMEMVASDRIRGAVKPYGTIAG